MIEMLPETLGDLIAVRMSGTVTEDEQDKHFAIVEEILDREKIENLFLDWEKLDGWAKGARSAGTWFGLHHRALVGRVAILAEEKWADEVLRITDVFKIATVRRFPPSERTEALEWVREV